MLFNKSVLISSCVFALATVASAAPTPADTTIDGYTAAVIDTRRFCLFLPFEAGGSISQNEDMAFSFCTASLSQAPRAMVRPAGVMPAGFIKSTHLVKTDNYVQLTGRINRSAYKLSKNDSGGQYDPKAPLGSSCAGYNYFVQLIEPDVQIYCIRCCKNKSDCPTDNSTRGCKAVLGGNYS
ncbi:hypothetical protein EDD21DRAFT_374742 [Dissophora ornata]|nr:hypothetical protein EDD21DRAFT_374742 [Dissophora ornata]